MQQQPNYLSFIWNRILPASSFAFDSIIPLAKSSKLLSILSLVCSSMSKEESAANNPKIVDSVSRRRSFLITGQVSSPALSKRASTGRQTNKHHFIHQQQQQQQKIMAGGGTSGQSLENTPTWAFATVCFFIIAISIIIEHSIHIITKWLKRNRKSALYDAVEKLKSELMLLGFMSLILAVTQEHISNICIPTRLADIMLPCRKETEAETTVTVEHLTVGGKVSLVSQEGIHQLHIFLFVLAVMQIVYSVLTMALGRLKMRRWKAWEKETQTTEYQAANGMRHDALCNSTAHLWIKCFFRQFFKSVAKVDYLTLRHGFISAHLSERHNNFNFQKYIQRSLEEDFKVIVSISPLLWLIVVIFMLVVVQGWHVYLFISFIPLLIVLVLGTKLEVIVARMALRLNNQDNVIIGAPLVQPHDDLFWFGRPRFVLTLLHLTLFLNAFELAFFVWVTIQFGFNSCYHEHTGIIVTRVVLAVAVQVLCSYITLPLYALVTQMGSQFKSKVLEEKIANIIKQWHAEVRVKRKKQEQCSLLMSPRTSLSTPDWSLRNSPTDFSSHHHHRPTSTTPIPTDQTNKNNCSNRGEITEEKVDTPDDHRAPDSTWLPYQASGRIANSEAR
ncbi:MLO-like protein 3 [Camellia lanceoleosa]|uniref:MLO-like protein 3 n=1 Tax=Camellia lanceoleosa TaxID=1840588 RepID=A0ACC0G9K3_9ERIC|nr:MLO-like protein 3 [Camellia lanceoleosa]